MAALSSISSERTVSGFNHQPQTGNASNVTMSDQLSSFAPMSVWQCKRRASQPLGQKSAGCIFKNPPGASAGRMIDELGLKGLSVGDARVSDRHANFFVNAGKASAKDMLALIASVRERVHKSFGVILEYEVVVWNG